MTKSPTATLLVLALAAGTLVGAFYPRPTAPSDSLGECVSEANTLVTETQALRSIAKEQIAREVADDRRPLLEAAALFGALNRLPPELPPQSVTDLGNSHSYIPVWTEQERLCQQVIAWIDVRVLYDSPPGRGSAVISRLAAEYRRVLLTQGGIRLPDPSTLEPLPELLARVRNGLTERQRKSLAASRREDG